MKDQDDHKGSTYSLAGSVPVHTVSVRGLDGERRLPVDIVREDILPLAKNTWILFRAKNLAILPSMPLIYCAA